jgi:UDP-galactopyranose mutase
MKTTIVCFSHLRWAFTFQRPNHLMSRFSNERRVFYIEEPLFDSPVPVVSMEHLSDSLTVCVPHLPSNLNGQSEAALTRLIAEFLAEHDVVLPVLWFYTPMALPLADGIRASAVVYDCMDELSLFQGAPPELLARERALIERADLVFTGGHSLYEAKRSRHPAVYAFPSSVDVDHFAPGAHTHREPEDQRRIPGARIGFFGVIDERMDVELLRAVAAERPRYQFVLVGPIVKISQDVLPRAANIHYLGPRSYARLPAYLRGWDVAIMPFALNDATKFISPTKTLEYIAGGKPVVSTAVRDVVVPYGQNGIVRIADQGSFAAAIDAAIAESSTVREQAYQEVLRGTSWEKTWKAMSALIEPLERDIHPPAFRSFVPNATQGAAECSTT